MITTTATTTTAATTTAIIIPVLSCSSAGEDVSVLPAALLLLAEGRTLCLRRSTDGALRLSAGALAAAVALQSLVLFASAAYKP